MGFKKKNSVDICLSPHDIAPATLPIPRTTPRCYHPAYPDDVVDELRRDAGRLIGGRLVALQHGPQLERVELVAGAGDAGQVVHVVLGRLGTMEGG